MLKKTVQSCEFYGNIIETDGKRFELRAQCFPPDQLASSSARCQGSSYLTRKIDASGSAVPRIRLLRVPQIFGASTTGVIPVPAATGQDAAVLESVPTQ